MANTMNQNAILGLGKSLNNSKSVYLYTSDVVEYYKKLNVTNPAKSASSALSRLRNNNLIRRIELGLYKII